MSIFDDKVPWSIQQTFLGIFLTIVPWIVLAFGLSHLSSGSPPNAPLPLQVDLANAVITLIYSALVEGAFLLAPLYFACSAFPHGPERWRLALQALGFRRFNVRDAMLWIVALFVLIIAV